MNKQFSAALLLAGTAIGSGMISLPLILAKFGILTSSLIMLAFAGLTYITALIRADLNLNSKADATLGEVGRLFGCKRIGMLGEFALQALSFALMSAYIFGGSSILHSFMKGILPLSSNTITAIFAGLIFLIFLSMSETIVRLNKVLFTLMFVALILLVQVLLWRTPIHFIPNAWSNVSVNLKQWTIVVPIIFTSFGFQGSIHSVTKFAKNDREVVKRACLIGSLIPTLVYILWTATVLIVVANTDNAFFQLMLSDQVIEVGELVRTLSMASSTKTLWLIVWLVSFLSLLTSVLGVGLALLEMLQRRLPLAKWQTAWMVVSIPAVVAMIAPNAFVRMLNISGIILAIIAIIVPTVILLKMQKIDPHKTTFLSQNRAVYYTVLACGIAIILLGILDIIPSNT